MSGRHWLVTLECHTSTSRLPMDPPGRSEENLITVTLRRFIVFVPEGDGFDINRETREAREAAVRTSPFGAGLFKVEVKSAATIDFPYEIEP